RPGLNFTQFYAEPVSSDLVPFVAIPTTAGTGSEVGRSSVITLDATHSKAVLVRPAQLAKFAIHAPTLTLGLPPILTAGTGAQARPLPPRRPRLRVGGHEVLRRRSR